MKVAALGLAACICAASCAGFAPAVPASRADGPMLLGEDRALGIGEAAYLAVVNSDELEYQRGQLELRRGAWRLGLRAFFPSLRLDYGNDERLSLEGGDSFSKSLSLGLSQLLWDGGRLAASREIESSQLGQAELELSRRRAETADSAVAAYRSIEAARLRLSVRLATLEFAQGEVSLLEAKRSLGFLTEAEAAEARLKLEMLGLEVERERLNLSEAEAQLAQLLGLEALPPLGDALDPELRALDLHAEPIVELALARSAELNLARQSVERKRLELKAARRQWLPALSLDATLGAGGAELPLRTGSWTLALRLSFEHPWLGASLSAGLGGSSQAGKTAQSALGLRAAPEPAAVLGAAAARLALGLEEARLADAAQSVRLGALSAIRRYQSAARAVELARRALALAADGLALAHLRAGLGQATASEVLDAELARAAKEVELVDGCVELLARERELENLLDMEPGQLARYLMGATI